MDYRKMKELVDALSRLLEKPEPGLFNYNFAVVHLINKINNCVRDEPCLEDEVNGK